MTENQLRYIIRNIIIEGIVNSDSSFVKNILLKIKDIIVNKDFGNLEIEKELNLAFNNHNIIFERNDDYTTNELYSKLSIHHSAILSDGNTIVVYYSDNFYRNFDEKYDYDDYLYNDFINCIITLVGHEMVHKEQFARVKDDIKKFDSVIDNFDNEDDIEKYLSNKNEIMAFAKTAILELESNGYTKKQILDKISNVENSIFSESEVLFRYYKYFDINSKEIKLLLKYMYLYLI